MKHGVLLGVALALGALNGCNAPEKKPAAVAPAAAVAAPAAATAASTVAPAARQPFAGYHRYRGTVGGQPVTVALTFTPVADKKLAGCEGSYVYDRHPAGLLVLHGPQPFYPQRPLALAEADTARPTAPTGRWQAKQPAGPLLTGTWTSPAGKPLPFELREDYTDGQGHLMAVRYEVVSEAAEVPCRPEREEDETKAEYRRRVANVDHGYHRQFLHLLGPDTLRPTLQAVQCPGPAARRKQVRAAAREDGCNFHTASLDVDYNAYGLLALIEYWEDDFITGARPQHGMNATVYDLRDGGVVTMADVFRPGTDTLIQRLITQHLLRDANPDIDPKPGMAVPTHAEDLAPLPAELFSLTDTGLAFGYEIDRLAPFTEGGHILCWVPVPYADLIPLLRPDSPVARMLRQRGLWPGAGPTRQ